MNTHDKYELPPLPEPFTYTRPGKSEGALFHAGQMQDYARAAIAPYAQRIRELESQLEAIGAGGATQGQRLIEADRKRIGEPVVMREICPECGHQFECFHNGYINELRAHVTPQPAEPPFCEECGDGIMAHDPGICGTCYSTKHAPSCDMDEHACNDPSQCWEPCGELGKSIEHAKAAEPVEVPSGDELLLSIINYADARATITENRLEGADRETDRIAHDECAQAYADMVALLARYGQNPTMPAGWKLVPKVPTHEMIAAFVEQWYCHRQSIDDPQMDDAYQAMLEAAPEPPCTL